MDAAVVQDRLGELRRVAADLWRSESNPARVLKIAVSAIVFDRIIQLFFHLSLTEKISGLALGSLYGIVGVGIILIFRTHRIINFAAGAIGAVPAMAAVIIATDKHLNYLVVLPIALFGGIAVGAAMDVLVMRRFSRSPRLIVTVVSIGLAQGLAIFAFFIPIWVAGKTTTRVSLVPTPWDSFKILNAQGQPLLTGNQVAAFVTVIVMAALLGGFLRYTRIGIALRASAENEDRAYLLGIPVRHVQTVAWALAGGLAAMAIFVQAPLIGIPNDATLGFDTLLWALAAAVVARMERLGVALVAGMGVGVLIFASVARGGDNNLATALMLVVILAALLLQRGQLSRAYDAGTSTWESVKQFRPIPLELRAMPEVAIGRIGVAGLAVAAVLCAGLLVPLPDMPAMQVLPIYGIVAVSLVVLTGWAGQISLGQFGLVGIAAGAVAKPISDHNLDFFGALAIGIAAGALAAVIIGLPALRIQGLYLAVTTLAFAYAITNYGLNRHYPVGKFLLPTGFQSHIKRPFLYGRFDLESQRTFFFVCVGVLAAAMLAALAFRRNRSGRVLIASRDNQRAAPTYGVNLTRTRLAAFAVSGGIAGMAGVLTAYQGHDVTQKAYGVQFSILVFLFCVIGGLTSVPWAVWGAVSAEAGIIFLPRLYTHLSSDLVAVIPLLLTGPLLVLNLFFYPGGLAERGFHDRDRFLRWVARRHKINVPSLIVERTLGFEEAEQKIVESAEERVEASEGLAAERAIACPVCGEVLAVEVAADHPHFRVGVKA
jgi:branched-chain amino acid transport system permease protein